MAIIRVTDFGGEAPRVEQRDLPAGGATVNNNLLATSSDFRPLRSPLSVATASDFASTVTNAKSLFRRMRGSDGQLRTGSSDGWYANALDLNFVRFPSADNATERTAVSFNDGSVAPRASDITNEASPWPSRPLGAPKPATPIVTLNATKQFTLANAREWQDTIYLPQIKAAFDSFLVETQDGARINGGATVAGITSVPSPYVVTSYPTSQRGKTEPWNVLLAVNPTTAALTKLDDQRLGGILNGGYIWLGLNALPFWGRITNTSGFTTAIGDILNPRYSDGTKLWSGAMLTAVSNGLMAFFDATAADIMPLRSELDQAFVEFNASAYYAAHSFDSAPAASGTEPMLTDATYSGWVKGTIVAGFNGDTYISPNAKYTQWENDHAAWAANNLAYTTFKEKADAENLKRVSAMVAAQAKAADAATRIEALYRTKRDGLMDTLKAKTEILGLVKSETNPNGIIDVDADQVIEDRFYVLTWVDDWGQESAPCDATSQLTMDQNDTATITMPTVPSGRSIVKYRVYRSVAGTDQAAFMFVAEVLTSATTTRTIGGVTTTVNGYTDARLSSDLREGTLKTTGWDEPPVRTATAGIANTNPYLRGLAGGPGGVVAGFIDNLFCACEPYYPYAWPAKYQQPLLFPIVCVLPFGTSWFVGTKANPYILYGDSPANYVPQKLNDAQACVSARGAVAAMGGVFYPSPDGYCFASQNGVEVVTQGLFSQEDWKKLAPESIFAVVQDSVLYFWYTGNGGGCYGLDMVAKKLTRHDIPATAVYQDVVTDAAYVANDGEVFRLFAGDRATGRFVSGEMVLQSAAPFAWLKIVGEQTPDAPVTFKWWARDVPTANNATPALTLRRTATVSNILPVRLPAGRYMEHMIEISSQARVTDVLMASSTEEVDQT